MRKSLLVSFGLMLCAVALYASTFSPGVVHSQGPNQGQIEVNQDVNHDVSPPLADINPQTEQRGRREKPVRQPHGNGPGNGDPVRQTSVGPLVGTTAGLNFAGVGNGDPSCHEADKPSPRLGKRSAPESFRLSRPRYARWSAATRNLAASPPIRTALRV